MTTETEESAPSTPTTTTAGPKVRDGEKVHPLSLTQGAVHLLRLLLGQPGWAKKRAHHRQGVKLLKLLPKGAKPPKDDPEAEDFWAAEPVEVELLESERKVGSECLKHFLNAGAVGVTEHTDRLLTEFGVTDGE